MVQCWKILCSVHLRPACPCQGIGAIDLWASCTLVCWYLIEARGQKRLNFGSLVSSFPPKISAASWSHFRLLKRGWWPKRHHLCLNKLSAIHGNLNTLVSPSTTIPHQYGSAALQKYFCYWNTPLTLHYHVIQKLSPGPAAALPSHKSSYCCRSITPLPPQWWDE